MNISFLYYKEYYRVSAVLYATPEGLYKEVPEDSGSDVLGVEVVYRICVASPGGELLIHDFFNPPAKDKDGEEGGPVNIDGNEWYIEPGTSTTPLECTTKYSAWGDIEWQQRVAQMHAIAKGQEEDLQ
jgi:hypothetical protein